MDEYGPENEPGCVGIGAAIVLVAILFAMGYLAYIVVERIIIFVTGG